MKKQGLKGKEMLRAEKAAIEHAKNSIDQRRKWDEILVGTNDEQKRYLLRVIKQGFNDGTEKCRHCNHSRNGHNVGRIAGAPSGLFFCEHCDCDGYRNFADEFFWTIVGIIVLILLTTIVVGVLNEYHW